MEHNSSRYAGINLIIKNDLDSDVFLMHSPHSEFIAKPINTKEPFRLPDLDERKRQHRKSEEGKNYITHPFWTTDTFMFVWSGNTGYHHLYSPSLSADKPYFAITYYHCKDKAFYTKSLKIVEANQKVDDIGTNRAESSP